MSVGAINVNNLLNHAKFSRFHFGVVFWCTLINICDGYDLVIYGVVLPRLMEQWSLSSVQAGMLASTAMCGMLCGALLCGILADKFGRKKLLLLSVFFLSTFTFLGGFASTPTEFAILRFLAGLGIGGAMPNVVALTSEYAPKKMRVTMVSIMSCGYAVGAIISALVGSVLVEKFGWQIMFMIAGIPLLFIPVMWKYLPESLVFSVKQKQTNQAHALIAKVSPETKISQGVTLTLNESIEKSYGSVRVLFQEGRAAGTFKFWVAFFMCLLIVYALSSWLPKLMYNAGYPLGKSILFLLAMNVGGIIGGTTSGMLADKFHIKPVVISLFCIAALSLIALGFNSSAVILYTLVAIAGASIQGASILLYSYVAQFYPLVANSTGIGWASAIGRTGAIAGPILAGMLLLLNLPHLLNFVIISVPAIIAAIAIILLKSNKNIAS
ncbi:MFS transporter [Acinetobacter qingfengensis]|uniref:MFS transporter n=1 Tax=Acinetobacter qingfengensis TaxID=1262585 RepID=A0A1E7RCF3_9GAMM|nr:MFS transporter [Acinetobacter qingfengensis]KAA8735072.1 MFS transporter [Acinetobacter qingfengensis]OEY97011.1 MFS transporter [Acinetobacter qingfengensis]